LELEAETVVVVVQVEDNQSLMSMILTNLSCTNHQSHQDIHHILFWNRPNHSNSN